MYGIHLLLGCSMRAYNILIRFNSHCIARRYLGNAARGPALDDISGNFNEAKKLFYKPQLSHSELQQSVESLRLFLFWGIVGYCTLDLIINPLKSNYWHYILSVRHLYGLFVNKQSENVFYTSKSDDYGNTDAWRQYLKLYK